MAYLDRYRSIVPNWDQFIASLNRPLPSSIWVNRLLLDRQSLLNSTGWCDNQYSLIPWYKDGLRFQDPGLQSSSLPEYAAGFYYVQEEVSMLPALLLDPQPHERICDLCASPGSKTALMAVMMNGAGTIVANDRNVARIRILHMTIARLGLCNVTTTIYDGIRFPLGGGEGCFDKVLVDAPCSGEGTSRKNQTAFRHKIKPLELYRGGLQIALLNRGVKICKPKGRIIYSTCTYRPEENEVVVQSLLETGKVRLLDAAIPGFCCSQGITKWQGRSFDEQMTKCMRIWPHQNDTGGFFIACFEKLS